jgi:hypothetical protein
MALTKRQRIVNEVQTELEGISITNGYQVDITTVDIWRSASFAVEELNALILRDLDEPIDEAPTGRNRHKRSLHIQIEIVAAGSTSPEQFRALLGAVEQAIQKGAQGEWNKLAIKTRPRISRMVVEQESKKVAGGIYECFIDYITEAFNAYQ